MLQSDHILECRARWLTKLAASGRTQTPRGKTKRKHPKRHGENRERSRNDRRKAREAKAKQTAYNIESKRRSAVVAAYFRGETNDLSAL